MSGMETWDKPKNCLSILPTILQISFQFKTMSLKLSRQRQTFERNWNAIKFFTPIVKVEAHISERAVIPTPMNSVS